MRTRIVLADSHTLCRAGLRALLEREGDFAIVGEASTSDQVVDLARRDTPDIVLMDLSIPPIGGLAVTRRIAALDPPVRVLVVTEHSEDEYLLPSLDAGASGFLSKYTSQEELFHAIRALARGEAYLAPSAARLVLLQRDRSDGDEDAARLHRLTPREREVLALTAGGYSSTEVGRMMLISPKTVETYRERAMQKLGLRHRPELVRFALEVGLLKKL
jgi:DNA-binding NarL/FixJ family response regulator